MKRLICILNIIILLLLCCCAPEKEEISMPETTLTVMAEATPTITPTPKPTAEPTPSPTPFDENNFTLMYVKGDNVNVRALPSVDSDKISSLNKNHLLKFYNETDGWCYVSFKEGSFGYVKKVFLSKNPAPTPTPTPKPMATPKPTNKPTVREDNVPSNYNGKYVIKVNLLKNFVSVYQKNEDGLYTKRVKSFVCSVGTGPDDDFTPTGSFYTSDKYEWRSLFGGTFGRYATRISGTYLFHSVPYTAQKKDALKSEEYNKLGVAASQGCIRMTVRDAKWLYDNCAKKTFVYIYEKDEPIPTLESFEAIDLSDPRCGWDPTDPDKSNPW